MIKVFVNINGIIHEHSQVFLDLDEATKLLSKNDSYIEILGHYDLSDFVTKLYKELPGKKNQAEGKNGNKPRKYPIGELK